MEKESVCLGGKQIRLRRNVDAEVIQINYSTTMTSSNCHRNIWRSLVVFNIIFSAPTMDQVLFLFFGLVEVYGSKMLWVIPFLFEFKSNLSLGVVQSWIKILPASDILDVVVFLLVYMNRHSNDGRRNEF